MEIKQIPLRHLKCNEGQMEGLPANPRFITDVMMRRLEISLEETPEMLELRELIVMPYGDQYIVIGGNMRLRAAQAIGMHSLPCKVLPADTPVEKLKEYTIKDNGDFGAYDFDILANEWDDMPLIDWGVQMPHIGEQEDDEYNPDGNSVTPSKSEKNSVQGTYLSFGNNKIQITETEKEALQEKLDKYTNEVGTSYGFVNHILNNENGAN